MGTRSACLLIRAIHDSVGDGELGESNPQDPPDPICRNPTLAKCGGEAQHLEKLEVGSLLRLPNVQSSTAGGKTPRIGVFLVSLKRS